MQCQTVFTSRLNLFLLWRVDILHVSAIYRLASGDVGVFNLMLVFRTCKKASCSIQGVLELLQVSNPLRDIKAT